MEINVIGKKNGRTITLILERLFSGGQFYKPASTNPPLNLRWIQFCESEREAMRSYTEGKISHSEESNTLYLPKDFLRWSKTPVGKATESPKGVSVKITRQYKLVVYAYDDPYGSYEERKTLEYRFFGEKEEDSYEIRQKVRIVSWIPSGKQLDKAGFSYLLKCDDGSSEHGAVIVNLSTMTIASLHKHHLPVVKERALREADEKREKSLAIIHEACELIRNQAFRSERRKEEEERKKRQKAAAKEKERFQRSIAELSETFGKNRTGLSSAIDPNDFVIPDESELEAEEPHATRFEDLEILIAKIRLETAQTAIKRAAIELFGNGELEAFREVVDEYFAPLPEEKLAGIPKEPQTRTEKPVKLTFREANPDLAREIAKADLARKKEKEEEERARKAVDGALKQ